ncbi:MAG: hypothetical protein LUD02_05315 [Tannerellaceae bacterium]|nr:hypothetical protein [Tannerellaceae bacterium]MCD8263638.1 hypothetical protein [Tannerellaceae bacterium]
MRKVLIICDIFPPAFGPRMGYLCKYLKLNGWEPIVIAEQVEGSTFSFLTEGIKVYYVNFYPACNKWVARRQWLFILILDLLTNYKERVMYHKASKLLEKEPVELVLASTFRTFPLPAALKVSQSFNLPLIADLRDIIEQYTGLEFIKHQLPKFFGIEKLIANQYKKSSLKKRNKVLTRANHITTISNWHQQMLATYNPNTTLIFNGFDPELFYPVQSITPAFIISYTGRLLSTAMRDPSLLIEALQSLKEENPEFYSKCQVHWYVDNKSEEVIKKIVRDAQVEDCMFYKGYIPATAIPEILNTSSILLLLTNKSGLHGSKGVMTTKFFEALAVEKPILCIRSDEDCLERAIREAGAGLAGRKMEEVRAFLLLHFNEWKEKGYTHASVNREVLKKYSRKEQAKQFIELFEQLVPCNHSEKRL